MSKANSYNSRQFPRTARQTATLATALSGDMLISGLLLLTGLTVGCGSTGIQASRLPGNFQASSREHSSVMDFSRVSSVGTSDSTIGPRDLLKITVASGRDQEKPEPVMVRVAQNGTVDVPLIGVTKVAGMEAHVAGQTIAQAGIERQIYVRPYVTVEIDSKAVRSVTVLGAVQEPGVHELPYGNCNLVTALAAAGGLSEDASTEVEIIRQPTENHSGLAGDPLVSGNDNVQLASYQSNHSQAGNHGRSRPLQVMRMDLSEGQTQTHADTRLVDRDVVKIIPRAEEMVFVTGLVRSPGQYEMPLDQDVHLLDAIAMAGGQSSPVADKLLIIRRVKDQPQPIVINASLSAAKRNGRENIRLAPGDTVSIEQTPTTVVVDTFRQIFRVSFGVASRVTSL